MEAPRRVIKLKKAPPAEAPSLIHSPQHHSEPYWFKLGTFKYVRIGKHIYEKDGTYMGDYLEKEEVIDTTAEGGDHLEEKARLWAATHK